MALLLASVASISLLVGGIGIMNILLGLGDRAHARDRPAHGDRRAPRCTSCCSSSPRPCCSALIGGARRHSRRHRRVGDDLRASPAGRRRSRRPPIAGGFAVLGRGRHLLRLLPGAQGRAPRSDRGATLRVVDRTRRIELPTPTPPPSTFAFFRTGDERTNTGQSPEGASFIHGSRGIRFPGRACPGYALVVESCHRRSVAAA